MIRPLWSLFQGSLARRTHYFLGRLPKLHAIYRTMLYRQLNTMASLLHLGIRMTYKLKKNFSNWPRTMQKTLTRGFQHQFANREGLQWLRFCYQDGGPHACSDALPGGECLISNLISPNRRSWSLNRGLGQRQSAAPYAHSLSQPQSTKDLIKQIGDAGQSSTVGVQQIRHIAQQVAQQVPGSGLRRNIEIDLVEVNHEAEQIQMQGPKC